MGSLSEVTKSQSGTFADRCGTDAPDWRKAVRAYRCSEHAKKRMQIRHIAGNAIEAALTYGRLSHVRGAEVYALGRKEVERFASWGVDLSSHSGVQVVCVGRTILTVYRNHDFRSLRRKKWQGRGSKKAWKYAARVWPGSFN